MKSCLRRTVVALILLSGGSMILAEEIGAEFTYQAQLKLNDVVVNEICDFSFRLWDEAAGGAQVGATLTFDAGNALNVVDGLVSVPLDFGEGAFGDDVRWLEVSLVCPSGGVLETLDPRQKITPAPSALKTRGIDGHSLDSADGSVEDAVSVDDAGNVGIGTTTPLGKLHVDGGIVTSSGWIGTKDDTPVELYVNDVRAMRFEYAEVDATPAPNYIGGHLGNTVTPGAGGAVVAGGGGDGAVNAVTGDWGTVSGGKDNLAFGARSVVSGGDGNTASGDWSTVSGGQGNTATGDWSAMAGGRDNNAQGDRSVVAGGAQNTASGVLSTIGGGELNTASGDHSMAPGGFSNVAAGNYSFAAGRRAKANHAGSFVWGDSTAADFASTANDQFLIRANRVGIGTSAPRAFFHNAGDYYGRGAIYLHALEGDGASGIAYLQARDLANTGSNIDLQLRTQSGGNVVETMRLTSGGNVGIGTASPSAKLDVVGSSEFSNGDMTINSNIVHVNNHLLVDGQTLVVNSITNRVGIGIQNPGAALHVAGHGDFTGSLSASGGMATVSASYVRNALFQDRVISHVDLSNVGVVTTYGANGSVNNLLSWTAGTEGNGGIMGVCDSTGTLRAGFQIINGNQGHLFADIKNFRAENPRDSSTQLWYASIEGPEAAAYTRGTAHLVAGEAVIQLPDHFVDVCSETAVTVQLTPRSDQSLGLAFVAMEDGRLTVRELHGGKGSYDFDYLVMDVRDGYEDYQVIRPRMEEPSTSRPAGRPAGPGGTSPTAQSTPSEIETSPSAALASGPSLEQNGIGVQPAELDALKRQNADLLTRLQRLEERMGRND